MTRNQVILGGCGIESETYVLLRYIIILAEGHKIKDT